MSTSLKPSLSSEAGIDHGKAALDVWLSEYKSLREEIMYRMRAADGFAAASITITGVVLGVALNIFLPALLILPLLNFYFMFAYLNQLSHVRVLGDYVRDRIKPRLAALTRDETVFGWESYFRALPHWGFLPWLKLPNAGFMILVSGIALGMTYDKALVLLENRWLWWIGITLTVFAFILWVRDEIRLAWLERAKPVPWTQEPQKQ